MTILNLIQTYLFRAQPALPTTTITTITIITIIVIIISIAVVLAAEVAQDLAKHDR